MTTEKSKQTQIAAYERYKKGYYSGKQIPPSVLRQIVRGAELTGLQRGNLQTTQRIPQAKQPKTVVVTSGYSPTKQYKKPVEKKDVVERVDSKGVKKQFKRRQLTVKDYQQAKMKGKSPLIKTGYNEAILRSLIGVYDSRNMQLSTFWVTHSNSSAILTINEVIETVINDRDNYIENLNRMFPSLVYKLERQELIVNYYR